jgi:ATP-dependent DNA ligase
MLAKLTSEIPEGEGWLYEPKWDGFRAIAFVDGGVTIGSRNTQPLDRYFPEVCAALRAAIPDGCVVDGEIVVAGDEGLEFETLQMRIHPAASRVKMLAESTPATFIAFDLLAVRGEDLRARPFHERRAALEDVLAASASCFVTPQTADIDEGRDWFVRFEGAGLDGIIARPFDVPYVQGQRALVKVKHERTVDCVIGGYRIHKRGDGVGSFLLGLYDDKGSLHYVGFTATFKAAERPKLLEMVRPLEGGTSFGEGRTPGGPSRWTGGQDNTAWTTLRPELVCEVSFDHLQKEDWPGFGRSYRFRHGSRLVRFRPDKLPSDCTMEQLAPPEPVSLDEIRELAARGG